MSVLEKAIQASGTQAELARRLGVSQQRLANWKLAGRRVPSEFCIPIEWATGGKVTRYDLRPDVFRPEAA